MATNNCDVYEESAPDGETLKTVMLEDYVRITFLNVYKRQNDTREGFVTRIRSTPDDTLMELDDGTTLFLPRGDLYIDDRKRGSVKEIEVVEEGQPR